jgi:hypothetical protein
MFKFESFFKKGQEDVKKVAKIGTLAVGIGAGVISGAEKVQAQDMAHNNKIDIEAGVNKTEPAVTSEQNYNFQEYFNKEKGYNPAEFNEQKVRLLEATIKSYHEALIDEDFFLKPNEIIGAKIKEDFKLELKQAEETLQKTLSERGGDIKSYEDDRAEYDKIFEKLINHVAGSEYLEKLSKEYGCSVEEAKKIQEARVDAVKAGDYSLIQGPSGFNWRYEPDGSIKKNSAKVSLEYGVKNKDEIITHEVLGHKATFAEFGLSDKAQQTFKEAYRDNPEFLLNYAKEEKFNMSTPEKTKETFEDLTKYFSNISEMYARKKNLEMEMETLGIKKYGQKFTPEHIVILNEFKKQNKLSDSAKHFLEIIKPEYLEIIFNEIAENNLTPEDNFDRENKA